MTDHLADARTCIQSAAQAPHTGCTLYWLTAACEQIIAHLEAKNMPQEATVPQPERIDLMTDPKLHELLDQTKSGDQLILAHRVGKHTASISGPVLSDQTHDPAVGIHLLDGDPHIVRTPTGVVWAPVVQAALYRGGEPIAKWDAAADHLESQQASPQPATAPPAAQQGDSGHREGGEAVQAVMAVLCDEGADSEGGWHSWRCFDRERYPEPCDCTKQVARAAIAAAEPHIRAEIADEIEAMDLSDQYGPLTAHGARTDAARIARQEQP